MTSLEEFCTTLRQLITVVNEITKIEQRRIDAALIDGDGVRPLAADIIRPDVEVLVGGVVGGDHVEAAGARLAAIMIADSGRKHAAGGGHMGQLHLGGPGQHMADLIPVDQVIALKERHAGKILKGRADQIVLPIRLTDAGIGIKAGKNRVFVAHFHHPFMCPQLLQNRALGAISAPH